MKLLREVTFFAAAFSLANVWFVLLLIPWGTRKMLLADPSLCHPLRDRSDVRAGVQAVGDARVQP
jgi:hypothetical protein